MKSTTINVDVRILEQIKEFSKKSGLTQTEIVKKILKKVAKSTTDIKYSTGLNHYQDHCVDEGFKKIHINFDEDEIWMIKLAALRLKLSVSKMLFLGFVFWFKVLIKSIKKAGHKIEKLVIDSYTSLVSNIGFYCLFRYTFLQQRIKS